MSYQIRTFRFISGPFDAEESQNAVINVVWVAVLGYLDSQANLWACISLWWANHNFVMEIYMTNDLPGDLGREPENKR